MPGTDVLGPALSSRRLLWVRVIAALALAATVFITWPLWHVRTDPPLLPLFGVPQAHVAVPLLFAGFVAVLRPRWGALLLIAVVLYAVVADQTRLQPELVSLALLIVAAGGRPTWVAIGRAHLASLWFWSGASKLLSTMFFVQVAPWMRDGLPAAGALPSDGVGWAVIVVELFTGVAVLVPRLRRLGVVLAVLLHTTTFYVLSPLGNDWNPAVWPWNIALAGIAVLLFWEPAHVAAWRLPPRWLGRAAVAFVLAFPVGQLFGVVDAYLAHSLYSAATPRARVCDDGGCSNARFSTWGRLRAPLPPEPRLYAATFERTCEPGEVLEITPRRMRVLAGVGARGRTSDCRRA
jgi:uncharacterized membrane protein YphA (DoxX/SURF4 family)